MKTILLNSPFTYNKKKKDDCRRLGLVKQTNIPSSNSQVHLPDFLSDKLE